MLTPLDRKDVAMSQRCATRYPLVLVPGMLGFIRLVLYPYWYGIVEALRRDGAVVILVKVSPCIPPRCAVSSCWRGLKKC